MLRRATREWVSGPLPINNQLVLLDPRPFILLFSRLLFRFLSLSYVSPLNLSSPFHADDRYRALRLMENPNDRATARRTLRDRSRARGTYPPLAAAHQTGKRPRRSVPAGLALGGRPG